MESVHYLINPAIVRNPMKRVNPSQTPGRPRSLGAQSRNPDDIAPTSICMTKKENDLCEYKYIYLVSIES